MDNKLISLAKLKVGMSGVVEKIDEALLPHNVELETGELERRLLEIGIIEGVRIKVMHFGLIKKDPIALQLNDGEITVAIRRNEAEIILVNQLETK